MANPFSGFLAWLKGDGGKQMLAARIAGATLTGVRQAFHGGASRNLTPQCLASMMRAADEGDPERYMELAEEIEEKDTQYLSVLGTRKRQVAQLPMTVAAASKAELDQVISKAVQEDLVDSGVVDQYLFDMLDAVGKGFSLGEIMWNTGGARWKPECIEHVDPRFVRHDRETMRIPMLLGSHGIAEPLQPFKFLYLELKAKSGIPIRGGLTRAAAWCYLFKNYGLKDWVQFCEIYGLPLRLGKYPQGASDDDKTALLSALAQIAVDAAGIIPQNMMIEFIETANNASSAQLYQTLLQYLDQQESKMVLGQTGTTDATGASGLGSGTEHTQVREDIERADANAVSAAINRQLVRPYVMMNFGEQQRYPWLRIGREDEADTTQMIDAAQKLVPLGLKVRADDIREAVGFSTPQEGDEVLVPPAAQSSPFSLAPSDATPAATARALAAAIGGTLNAGDAIDRAVTAELDNWREIMDPIGNQLLDLAAKCSSAEEFKRRLSELYPSIDTSAFALKLASLSFQSLAGGVMGDGLSKQG